MNLTEHFTLEELTFSQTAERWGIDNTPDAEALANLRGLANFLEVVRTKINKPIWITSGYRSPTLNNILRASRTSAHMDGRAADIVAPSFSKPAELAELIVALDLEFDQVILEFPYSPSGGWVHVAVADKPRHQILTARNTPAGVVYEPGILA